MEINLSQFYQVISFASLVINPLWARRQGKNAFLWFFLSLPFGPAATIFLFISMRRAEREDAKEFMRITQYKEAEELKKKQAEEEEEHRRRQAKEVAFNASYVNSRFKRPPVNLNEWEKTSADYRDLLRLIDCVAEGRTDSREAPNFPVKAKEVVFLKMFGNLTNHDGTQYTDSGYAYITNKRIVFDGKKKTSEWVFRQMIDFESLDARESAVFKCTDQSAVRGICLTGQDWFRFQFFLIAAFASAKGPIANLASLVASDCLMYDLQKPLSGK